MAFGLLLVIGVLILASIGSDLPPGCIRGEPLVGTSDKGHLILCGGNEGAVTINGVDILNTLTQLNHQVTTTFDFNSPSFLPFAFWNPLSLSICGFFVLYFDILKLFLLVGRKEGTHHISGK